MENKYTKNLIITRITIFNPQTAKAILKSHSGIQISRQNGLVEISHGLWEGKLESEIESEWPKLLETWKESPEKAQMPEGENIQGVWDRSIECWNNICNDLSPHETALVVAHDAVNKTILCHLLGLTPADIWMIKQGNGGVTIVDISNQKELLSQQSPYSRQRLEASRKNYLNFLNHLYFQFL